MGTGIGGIAAPLLFSALIQSRSRGEVFFGDLLGSAFMIAAAAVQTVWGIAAERKALEDVARPLTLAE